MRPGPALAATLVREILPLDGPPRPARDLLTEIIVSQGWTSYLDAPAQAERWEERFILRLRSGLTEDRDRGRITYYDFNSSSDYMVQGACFPEPGDSDELKELKRRRRQFGKYSSALEGIAPLQFEAVCRGILRTLGVPDPALTPYTADEGIDFYGRLRLTDLGAGQLGIPQFQDVLSVWLVGQAKHYIAGQVATPDVRELVGSVILARGGAFSRVDSVYDDLAIRPCDPVFYLFFTTGQISSAGWRLLKSSGAIGMDGGMVAGFLADSGVGMVNGQFDRATLMDWIAAQ